MKCFASAAHCGRRKVWFRTTGPDLKRETILDLQPNPNWVRIRPGSLPWRTSHWDCTARYDSGTQFHCYKWLYSQHTVATNLGPLLHMIAVLETCCHCQLPWAVKVSWRHWWRTARGGQNGGRRRGMREFLGRERADRQEANGKGRGGFLLH